MGKSLRDIYGNNAKVPNTVNIPPASQKTETVRNEPVNIANTNTQKNEQANTKVPNTANVPPASQKTEIKPASATKPVETPKSSTASVPKTTESYSSYTKAEKVNPSIKVETKPAQPAKPVETPKAKINHPFVEIDGVKASPNSYFSKLVTDVFNNFNQDERKIFETEEFFNDVSDTKKLTSIKVNRHTYSSKLSLKALLASKAGNGISEVKGFFSSYKTIKANTYQFKDTSYNKIICTGVGASCKDEVTKHVDSYYYSEPTMQVTGVEINMEVTNY